MLKNIPSGHDILGNIAVLKFHKGTKIKDKKKAARNLLKKVKGITTVLEKSEKVKGRLRTIKTKLLAGKNTKEALYRENNCILKLNIDSCYFSPRLSNERLELARKIKKKDQVLVMFAGVSPFSVVLAKLGKPKKVVSVELGKTCCKYGKENVKLNKLDNIEVLQGDVKKVLPRLKKKRIKFDKIVMPRPQLKDTFLKEAMSVAKKNTMIYYYGFGNDAKEVFEEIRTDIEKLKKKVKIINVKKAGNIAPYRFRWRVDMKVL
jgi:tRNA (guanine37-N1)-methyltransferase